MTPENTNPEGRCRECRRAAQRANPRHKERMKEWRARNPEKVKEHNAKRDLSDPGYLAKKREWNERHPEKIRLYGKTNYRRNRERVLAYQRTYNAAKEATEPGWAVRKAKEWAERNPDHARILRLIGTSRARARKMGAPLIPYSVAEYRAKMAYYGDRCVYCHGPFEHTDHVKPMSKGGMDALANLRPSCLKCNRAKSDTWPLTG